MRIAGVVIIYNPDKDLIKRIQSYHTFLDQLYIFDNTENTYNESILAFSRSNNIYYIHSGINYGIAKCLNEAAAMALAVGFELLLTMDQDSSFAVSYIEQYIKCLKTNTNISQIAMFGVEYRSTQIILHDYCDFKEVEQTITSGSVINLKVWQSLGGFDEALFIDEVDNEYCYRSIVNGYKIVMLPNIIMNHQLGIATAGRSLLTWKTTRRTIHTPKRLYYMVRNHLYVHKKLGKFLTRSCKAERNKNIFTQFKNNLLYSKDRITVIRYICKGILDFWTNKMGKLD